jgi:hypothetical protein
MAPDDWIGHLSTVSAYLVLPAEDRRTVFRRIREVLPDPVAVSADVVVHAARRR